MAGILKVDRVQSDSNLAINIAGSNVAFFAANTLSMGGNTIISGNKIVPAAQPTGAVLQVVSTTFNNDVSTTSTSYVDTGLSLGITLTNASNKVYIMLNGGHGYVNSYPNGMIETICRQSSTTYNSVNDLSGAISFGMTQIYNSATLSTSPHSINYLDISPGSITPTYRVFFKSRSTGNVQWQEGGGQVVLTLMEIAS